MKNSEKPKKPGRPSELTYEVQKKIVNFILGGSYLEVAAAAAGIHKSTLYRWLEQGEKQKAGRFRNFADAVNKARAGSEMIDVARIDKAARTSWQAAAWRLERKFPERWGRRDRLEHVGRDGGPIKVDETHSFKSLVKLTDDQVEDKVSEIVERLGGIKKDAE